MSTQYINKLWRILLVGIFSISTIALSSVAQAEGWYGGVGLGNSKFKDDTFCSDAASLFDPGFSCSSDDTDTGWKVFIGNQFNKNAAIEFGYIDLGKVKDSVFGTVLGVPTSANGDVEATGFNLAFIGSLPVSNEFTVLGRIGLFRWDADLSGSVNVGGFPASVSDSATGTDLTFGVGAQYDFSKSAGVRVEWERFQDVGDQDSTGQSDVDLLSLDLVFRFQ